MHVEHPQKKMHLYSHCHNCCVNGMPLMYTCRERERHTHTSLCHFATMQVHVVYTKPTSGQLSSSNFLQSRGSHQQLNFIKLTFLDSFWCWCYEARTSTVTGILYISDSKCTYWRHAHTHTHACKHTFLSLTQQLSPAGCKGWPWSNPV